MDSKLDLNRSNGTDAGKKINTNVIRIIKGSIFAILITLILLLIYALLLCYTNLPETTMVPVVICVSGISILIGSSISSMKIKSKGMLNGALVGLIYMVTIYFISSIVATGFALDVKSVIMILVRIVTGIVGGIIGVNI